MAEVHPAVSLALETIANGKQALVFADSKKSAEKAAEDIAKALRGSKELAELALRVVKTLPSATTQCARLAACLKKGIAFHHAGLVAKQRQLVEDAFRAGTVKVICSTPTLAYGVDTPAFRVIIKSLKRYSGAWGMDWIPVLDYHQMCGRAGRPKFHDSYGEALVIARSQDEAEELYSRYVVGKPEVITSKLAVEPVLRIHVLSLIATGFVHHKKGLIDFFSRTFWAHQYHDVHALDNILNNVLHMLRQWELIVHEDFVSAGEDEQLAPTLLGRRVAELYVDPMTAHHFIKGLRKASRGIGVFALLQLISHTPEMEPLLRTGSGEYEKIQSLLLEHYGELLEMEPGVHDLAYDDFINSIKTACFFHEWIDEKHEDKLLEQFAIRPGEVRGKIEIANWLLYTLGELAPLLQLHSLLADLKRIRLRVKYGVREELLTLLRLEGVGRMRARRLYHAGLKDIGDVKAANVGVISRLIGQKTALRVKKQLGQEITLVPSTKRKGQMGLGKF